MKTLTVFDPAMCCIPAFVVKMSIRFWTIFLLMRNG